MARKSKKDPVDTAIESAWYNRANGVQVNIMDIPAIFRECRIAMSNGTPVDAAVDACIAKYRKN